MFSDSHAAISPDLRGGTISITEDLRCCRQGTQGVGWSLHEVAPQRGGEDAEGSAEPRLWRCSGLKWLKMKALGHFFSLHLTVGM